MKIIENILTRNPCYKAGKKIKVKGLMLHSVGVPQPSALVFVKNWNNENYTRACVHAFLEADGDVYQCLPWDHRGWHGGGASNNTHIGVEMCEPSTIKYTGGASWTDLNPTKTKEYVLGTYKTAVELFAFLCNKFNLNPLEDGVIISHAEGHKRGIASNHGDPEHIWNKFGLSMNKFRQDVKSTMTQTSTEPTKPSPGALYRVQTGAFSNKSNADALLAKIKAAGFETYMVKSDGMYKVQVGAYSVKSNADAMAAKLKAKGFDVYITTKSGEAVSSSPSTSKTIQVGSKVKVKSGAKSYTGGGLSSSVYKNTYDVIQMNGDRIVIGIGKAVTAAINKKDLILQ